MEFFTIFAATAIGKDLILFFQSFPFGGTEPLMSVVSSAVVFAFMFLLAFAVIVNKRAIIEEVEPPEIKSPVPSCLVWNKNSRFVRIYHWLWREYPSNICEVTKKTLLALVFVPIMAISAITAVTLGVAALASVLYCAGWAILYLIAWGPAWIISAAIRLFNLVQEIVITLDYGVVIITFVAVFVSLLLIQILWKSNTLQVVKLAAGAIKNKFCLPIKII